MIKVVTDSSCDLPQELLDKLGIVVVPLVVRIGDEEFLETELGIDEYWAKVEAGRARGLFPQTSQPSIGAFESVFAPLVDEGHEVICVTITSKHSGTFNSAWAAAQRFGEAVRVIDSWQASLGLGFQAMAAAQAACNGATLSEVVTLLTEMRARAHLWAVLDTMEYVRMGGRADALIPILSRVMQFLQVKPIVGFVKGELRLLGQARTFSAALATIEQRMIELQPFEHLAVAHTRRPQEAQTWADHLREGIEFQGQIWVTETGAALSSHAGPGVIAAIGVKKGS
jgi:DegV family protein with EDD domain